MPPPTTLVAPSSTSRSVVRVGSKRSRSGGTARPLRLLAVLGLACVAGCNQGHGASSSSGPAASVDALLMTSTNGGASGVGRWTAGDPATLGATIAIAEARGGSHPSTSLLVGSAGGFTYSPADNKFYAVLPGAGAMYTKHRATDDLAVLDDAPGDVIRYDPVTNRVEYLASIPPLDPAGSGRVLNRYLTSPVVKADGKSLVLVAQAGGALNVPNPLPLLPNGLDNQAGALVHLDLDPASPGYLRFRAVYDFAEYGRSMPYWLQLRFVDGKPVPVLINGSEAIFLRSNLQRLDSQLKLKNTVGRQFCLQPRVDSDWSQPWQMVGSPGLLEGSQLVDQMYWDESADRYWWSAFADLVSTAIPAHFTSNRIGLGGAEWWETTYESDLDMRDPVSIFTMPGRRFGYVVTRGRDGGNTEARAAKIVQVEHSVGGEPAVLRKRFTEYASASGAQRWAPTGTAPSRSTGEVLITATSEPGAREFEDAIQARLTSIFLASTPVATDPLLGLSAEALYNLDPNYAPLPGRIDALDMSSFALVNLVNGSMDQGYVFVGAPALGGPVTDPVQDRYVVTLALLGGPHGAGGVIRHDRLTRETVAAPLGAATPNLPVGRPHQLASGVVIGGAAERTGAQLEPLQSEYGIWRLDARTSPASIGDSRLPCVDAAEGGRHLWYKPVGPPTSFAQADNGTLWCTTGYLAAVNLTLRFAGGLIRIDPGTGTPTGEVHLFGMEDRAVPALASTESVPETPVAHGDVVMFLTPTYASDAVAGTRVWCVDVGSTTPGVQPPHSFAVVTPGGAAGDAWRPKFGPTFSSATHEIYLMTTATGTLAAPTDEVRILRMTVGVPGSTAPTFAAMLTVPGPADLPGTPMFEASDGNLYYGTISGRLMKFDPVASTVTQAADFGTVPGFTTDCRGFLSEHAGDLLGVLADLDAAGSSPARRIYRYTLATGAVVAESATASVSDRDPFPGVLPVRR